MRLSLGMPSMRAFVNNIHPRRSGGAEQNGYQESTYRRLSPGYHMSTCKFIITLPGAGKVDIFLTPLVDSHYMSPNSDM